MDFDWKEQHGGILQAVLPDANLLIRKDLHIEGIWQAEVRSPLGWLIRVKSTRSFDDAKRAVGILYRESRESGELVETTPIKRRGWK